MKPTLHLVDNLTPFFEALVVNLAHNQAPQFARSGFSITHQWFGDSR